MLSNNISPMCEDLKADSFIITHIIFCHYCTSMHMLTAYREWKKVISIWKKGRGHIPGIASKDYYAKRPVGVPQQWLESFKLFYLDVGSPPGPEFKIRRKDTTRGFLSDNFEWYTPRKHINPQITVIWETPEYRAYDSMKSRCLNTKHKSYKNYGGRGITICERWLGRMGFDNFLEDVGYRPSRLYSLDRTNNNGNYEPSNCVWRTAKEQMNNRRNTRRVEYKGEMLTLSEISKRSGVPWGSLRRRYMEGLRHDDLVKFPRPYSKRPQSIILPRSACSNG